VLAASGAGPRIRQTHVRRVQLARSAEAAEVALFEKSNATPTTRLNCDGFLVCGVHIGLLSPYSDERFINHIGATDRAFGYENKSMQGCWRQRM